MKRPETPAEIEEAEEAAYTAARERLDDLGRWHDGLEEDVRAYARASVEADRALRRARAAAPGSRQEQVANAGAAKWERQRSILRRRIGLTAETKTAPGVALHEFFVLPEEELAKALAGEPYDADARKPHPTEEEHAETMRRLKARMALDGARIVAAASKGTRFEQKNNGLLRHAEELHGWVEREEAS